MEVVHPYSGVHLVCSVINIHPISYSSLDQELKVSLLLKTHNRAALTHKTVKRNLTLAGYDNYELLIWDNGSTEKNTISLMEEFKPAYHRHYPENIGSAQGTNQLILNATGDLFVDFGCDIQLPNNWLGQWVDVYQKLREVDKKVGVIAYHWGHGKWEKPVMINDILVCPTENAFGTALFGREVMDAIGSMNEWTKYGIWDGDFHYRTRMAGFENFHMEGTMATHMGHDAGQQTPYRLMKDENLREASKIWDTVLPEYISGKRDYFVTPPEKL